ncbi:D-alanine--D-alanine ligase [Verrucomicrobiota bacterium]
MNSHRFSHVGVLMGGISSEREISLQSGRCVADGLRAAGYQVTEIDVTSAAFELPPEVEAVFVALHGQFGEDGGAQQRLQELAVPYTGSGPEPSRIAFDKVLTRNLLLENGVPVAEGDVLMRGKPSDPVDVICPALAERFGIPMVIKPPREGSSIGVHIVQSVEELPYALNDAFEYGDDVLIEKFIHGRELTVGVVGDEVLPVVEIRAGHEGYDFEAKYVSDSTEYMIPAELDPAITEQAQALAKRTFEVLGCRGLGRVDFRLSNEGELFVLEMNNLPGFTTHSLLPKAAQSAGIEFPELCRRIMESAE